MHTYTPASDSFTYTILCLSHTNTHTVSLCGVHTHPYTHIHCTTDTHVYTCTLYYSVFDSNCIYAHIYERMYTVLFDPCSQLTHVCIILFCIICVYTHTYFTAYLIYMHILAYWSIHTLKCNSKSCSYSKYFLKFKCERHLCAYFKFIIIYTT